jgi:cephalosporin-C deacetylase-like acetyl esterase
LEFVCNLVFVAWNFNLFIERIISMNDQYKEFQYYPSRPELEQWIAGLWQKAQTVKCGVEVTEQNGLTPHLASFYLATNRYIKFTPENESPFYGYWQPAANGPAPLLVHVPGYGTEMSAHPDLVMQGFNVLHVNPLGYCTPTGFDRTKQKDNTWPVLPDTVASTDAQHGYWEWFLHCLLAINWAIGQSKVLPNRLSFFGTSQGGGGALILGSLFQNKGVRCVAADVPFLTNFPHAYNAKKGGSATGLGFKELNTLPDPRTGWRSLGFVDTMSHAHRLNIPVMMTAGEIDTACDAFGIASLFEKLPGTKMYYFLAKQAHAYTNQFMAQALAWFRLYA